MLSSHVFLVYYPLELQNMPLTLTFQISQPCTSQKHCSEFLFVKKNISLNLGEPKSTTLLQWYSCGIVCLGNQLCQSIEVVYFAKNPISGALGASVLPFAQILL